MEVASEIVSDVIPLSMRCTVQIVRLPAIFVRNYSIVPESNVAQCPTDLLGSFLSFHSHRHWPPRCKLDTDHAVDAESMR